MELIAENDTLYWVYKGEKLDIRTDMEKIFAMWKEYWKDRNPGPITVVKKWTGPNLND